MTTAKKNLKENIYMEEDGMERDIIKMGILNLKSKMEKEK